MTAVTVVDSAAPTASYHHREFAIEDLVAAKGSRQVVVCIPARDEEPTISSIVSTVRTGLVELPGRRTAGERLRACRAPLVDEILVVDDHSSDGTAEAARRAGAVVVRGPGLGKGEAMRLARGRGDFVVYLDGDVLNFAAHYVTGLLGPLLLRPGTVMVKGCYARPDAISAAAATGASDTGPTDATATTTTTARTTEIASGGGRVTELVAKPLLSLLFPELAWLSQPLAGETAIRADVLEQLELAPAYGVEIGLLIDVWRRHGTTAIAEVDLGARVHRNRPLHELAPQARDVMAAALARASLDLHPLRSGSGLGAHSEAYGPQRRPAELELP